MCNRPASFNLKLKSMSEDYVRLLEAARELRNWDTPAEVARGLTTGGFVVSDQILTNWKARGISALGVLEACRIIGCRCEYIRAGQLPLADTRRVDPFGELASRAAEIIEAMQPEDQQKLLHYLQVAKDQKRLLTK